jgi:hypothetical protein
MQKTLALFAALLAVALVLAVTPAFAADVTSYTRSTIGFGLVTLRLGTPRAEVVTALSEYFDVAGDSMVTVFPRGKHSEPLGYVEFSATGQLSDVVRYWRSPQGPFRALRAAMASLGASGADWLECRAATAQSKAPSGDTIPSVEFTCGNTIILLGDLSGYSADDAPVVVTEILHRP